MKTLKNVRAMAASLGVLAMGAVAVSPAMAFDNVEWNWKNDTKQHTDIDVDVNVDVESTGLVQIEKLQIFLGDVKASSYVSHIYNNPIRPDMHGGPGGDDGGEHGYDENSRGGPRVSLKSLDARIELPIVLSSATAVGNNQSITTDVPIFLHDGQFVANVKDHRFSCESSCDYGFDMQAFSASLPASGLNGGYEGGGYGGAADGNLHTDIAGLFTLGAVLGVLTKADIEAKSVVEAIRNASVDSSATAVANNLSVNLASDVDGGSTCNTGCRDRLSNHVVIGDITQFALANVTATSKVTGVSADGYDHMRQLTTATLSPTEGNPGNVIQVPSPWVSSTATAVGNNVSINVGRDLTP
ncbi:MAG: hypothetical protein ABL973_08650 [Micropepsaceae bacterium]